VTQRPALGCLFEVVETLVLTLLIFLVIQNFVAQPYQVKQQSMERTLQPGQYVLVDKLTPRFSPYKRGDIVVFTPPSGWTDNDTPFIKRVIGLAGDTIEIREDGRVYANEVQLNEPYLYAQNGVAQPTVPPAAQSRWVVGLGQLFVLGDHRMNSADSRSFGLIDASTVIGRAWLRYWPINGFGIVGTPTYPELQPAGA
jgi:signal peptidase I